MSETDPARVAAQYRKKPIVIEAFQVGSSRFYPDWLHDAVSRNDVITHGKPGESGWGEAFDNADITTLEGVMHASRGDWIIRGVKGELYPCKPDIFAATYEPAATPAAQPNAEPVAWYAPGDCTSDPDVVFYTEKPRYRDDALPLYAAPAVAAPAAPADWVKAVQEAYGWLWNINNEPMAPIPMLPEGKAAYQARKPLRDLLTTEQRGEAINAVRATLENMGALPPAVPKPEALGSLLRKPVKSIRDVSAQIPGGCYCPPGTCSAPVIMGRQTPCLRREDPETAAPAAGEPTDCSFDPIVRGKTLLSYLWRKYDAAGTSMGRNHEAVLLEAAMDLLDAWGTSELLEDYGDQVGETRDYLSRRRARRMGFPDFADSAEPIATPTQEPAGQEVSEYETRADGVRVRKDRWEVGMRRIVALLWGNRQAFEVDEIVAAVKALIPEPFNDGDDEGLVRAVLGERASQPAEAGVTDIEDVLRAAASWVCAVAKDVHEAGSLQVENDQRSREAETVFVTKLRAALSAHASRGASTKGQT